MRTVDNQFTWRIRVVGYQENVERRRVTDSLVAGTGAIPELTLDLPSIQELSFQNNAWQISICMTSAHMLSEPFKRKGSSSEVIQN
jgi:hypothetical protein